MQSCKFDQSAYISYLVEEAVKESEALEKPPISSEETSSPVTPDCLTSTYPVDATLSQNTDELVSPSCTNDNFHQQLPLPARGYINYIPTGHQSHIIGHQGPVSTLNQSFPESSPPFVTSSNYLGLQAHSTNFPSYHKCSFRLDQYIGLNQPPVVNASQLNNKIQVQYHFTDSDRFSVQSTNTTGTQVPNNNWQTVNNVFPNNLLLNTVEVNDNHTKFPREIDQNVLTINPSSHSYLGTSDYSQFNVANIIAKRTAEFHSDICRRETLPDIEKRTFTKQSEENEYCNAFMLKGKEKSRQKEQNKSNSKYFEDKNLDILNSVPKGQERNDDILSTSSDKYNIEKGFTKSVKKSEKVSIHRDKHNTCRAYTSCSVDSAVNNDIAESNQTTETEPDYHQFSREYYKEYLKFVKKQKEEKANSHSVATDSSGSKVTKDTEKEKKSLNYECVECMKSFNDKKEFKKHIKKSHSSKKKKDFKTVSKSNVINEPCVVDLMGSEILRDVSMADENEDIEKVVTENRNETSEPQSYLCSYCGYTSKSLSESSEHLKNHEKETEGTERLCQKEECEYLQMSKELLESKKIKEDIRKQTEEKHDREPSTRIKQKVVEEDVTVQKKPICYPLSCSKKMACEEADKKRTSEECSSQEEQRLGHKRKAATQAKNNLMNPSKGKQKRVRDMKNLNQEDESLMKMFGIIPSKVYLSRVKESGDIENCSENNYSEKKCQKRGSKVQKLNGSTSPKKRKTVNSESNKAVNIADRDTDFTKDADMMLSVNSDVEIVEHPETVTVLDKNVDESTKVGDSPFKSNRVILKEFGLKNVAIKLDKAENVADKLPSDQVNRIKTDTELLEKFGIKGLSVNVTRPDVARKKCSPSKLKKHKPGPKSKTQITEIEAEQFESASDVSEKNFEELSPDEIEKMLCECGMGISVPFSSKGVIDHRDRRTPSPVPSTSKGHGHLKRKRTARKSTKDNALFKKYKLKDSKVILKSLSKIDISLIRNPNSPFGKSDWLKHKFDSDTESDFEFDIPTPPLLEDFVESSGSTRMNTQSPKMGISESNGRGILKHKDLKIMEKFGIVDSVVVIDSPKKKEVPLCSETNERKVLSDDELRKKFGIPSTVVVVNSPGKRSSNGKKEQVEINVGKTPSLISFSDFRLALDSARKNILCKMKDNHGSDNFHTKNNVILKEANVLKNTTRKTKKAVPVKKESNSSQERLKLDGKETSGKRFILRSSRRDSPTSDDQKQTDDKPVTVRKEFPYSCNAGEKVLNKTLPRRLKTLSVEIKRLQLNEALKTYKAKAVSRAMEVRHKKKRKDTAYGVETNSEDFLPYTRKTRHKSKNVLSENSLKKIENTRKRKQLRKTSEEKIDTPVMKTAQYRLSYASKKQNDKRTKNSNLEKIAKKLPVVKVAVPCLSDDEISRLSHSVRINSDKTPISDAKKIAEEVIDEIIDKICRPVEVPTETCQQIGKSFLDKDKNEKDSSTSFQKIDPDTEDSQTITDEKNIKNGTKENNDYEKNSLNSAEMGDESNGEKKCKSETVLDGAESDLSLISIIPESKESEENAASYHSRKDCLTNVDDSIEYKDMCILKETGLRCIADYDSIPIGCSKFFDEGVKDNSFDEVDGDTEKPVIENPGELSSDEKHTEIKNTNGREFENSLFEMNMKQDNLISVESISNASEEKCDKQSCECTSTDDRSVSTEELIQNSILSSQNNETEKHCVKKAAANKFAEDNDPIEKKLSNENMCALNKAKLSENLQNDVSNRNIAEEDGLTEMRMLSSIIESGSGSRLRDVYTIEEIRKTADISDTKQEIFDVAKENLPECDQCKSSSELKETVMEH